MLLDLFITYITSLEPKTKLQTWMLNAAFVELREVEDYRVENDPFYPIQVIKSCWRYIELTSSIRMMFPSNFFFPSSEGIYLKPS